MPPPLPSLALLKISWDFDRCLVDTLRPRWQSWAQGRRVRVWFDCCMHRLHRSVSSSATRDASVVLGMAMPYSVQLVLRPFQQLFALYLEAHISLWTIPNGTWTHTAEMYSIAASETIAGRRRRKWDRGNSQRMPISVSGRRLVETDQRTTLKSKLEGIWLAVSAKNNGICHTKNINGMNEEDVKVKWATNTWACSCTVIS